MTLPLNEILTIIQRWIQVIVHYVLTIGAVMMGVVGVFVPNSNYWFSGDRDVRWLHPFFLSIVLAITLFIISKPIRYANASLLHYHRSKKKLAWGDELTDRQERILFSVALGVVIAGSIFVEIREEYLQLLPELHGFAGFYFFIPLLLVPFWLLIFGSLLYFGKLITVYKTHSARFGLVVLYVAMWGVFLYLLTIYLPAYSSLEAFFSLYVVRPVGFLLLGSVPFGWAYELFTDVN